MDIKYLKERQKFHEGELKKLTTAVKAFQEVCEHNYEYEGHDSHYNYEQCTICGKSIKV